MSPERPELKIALPQSSFRKFKPTGNRMSSCHPSVETLRWSSVPCFEPNSWTQLLNICTQPVRYKLTILRPGGLHCIQVFLHLISACNLTMQQTFNKCFCDTHDFTEVRMAVSHMNMDIKVTTWANLTVTCLCYISCLAVLAWQSSARCNFMFHLNSAL